MSGPHISEVYKGQTPTLLTTSKANELIKAINVLQNIEIFADSSDRVEYTDNGVYIYYEKEGLDISDTIRILDPSDITQQWTITIEAGTVTAIEYGSSGYSIKSVEICEDGATASYNFVIQD